MTMKYMSSETAEAMYYVYFGTRCTYLNVLQFASDTWWLLKTFQYFINHDKNEIDIKLQGKWKFHKMTKEWSR